MPVLAALVASCAVAPRRPDAARAMRPDVDARSVERAVHDATNVARRRRRVHALAHEDALAAVARRHSADMARQGYVAHAAPDGSDANVRAARADLACRVRLVDRTSVGFSENLAQVWLFSRWTETRTAVGTRRTYTWLTPDEIVAETVDGWLASPGHRRNLLLDHARREGVGVAIGDDGQVFVTQLLC